MSFRTLLSEAGLKGRDYWLFDETAPGPHWYPKLAADASSDTRFADFSATFSIPAAVEILGTGDAAGRAGRRTTTYTASDVGGMILAVGKRYRLLKAERNGIHVTAFDRGDGALSQYVEPTLDAAAWYAEQLQVVPYRSIGIIPGAQRAIGGTAIPGVFMVHLGYTSPEFIRLITAHEIGHFYWGQYVLDTEAGVLGPLMLGNGMWDDQLYSAHRTRVSLSEQWLSPDIFNRPVEFFTAQASNFDQRLDLTDATGDSLDYDYNSYVRHAKSAVGVFLTAGRVGHDRFLELQQNLLRKYRHQTLSIREFSESLEAAGMPRAREWWAAWVRGDARVAYDVTSVTRFDSSSRYRIEISRLGTIQAPFDVVVHGSGGDSALARVRGDETDTIIVLLKNGLANVDLDPDGRLPLWNSANPGMRGAGVRALLAVGWGERAETLAESLLVRTPTDSLTRAALVESLARRGRFADVVKVTRETASTCDTRAICRMLALRARALAETGDVDAARDLIERLVALGYKAAKEVTVGNLKRRRWPSTTVDSKLDLKHIRLRQVR